MDAPRFSLVARTAHGLPPLNTNERCMAPPASCLQSPFNPQDFHNDKLSVLDIPAIDQHGAIYDIETQLSISPCPVKRIVFYSCEVYAGQMWAGDKYQDEKQIYLICLLDGRLCVILPGYVMPFG